MDGPTGGVSAPASELTMEHVRKMGFGEELSQFAVHCKEGNILDAISALLRFEKHTAKGADLGTLEFALWVYGDDNVEAVNFLIGFRSLKPWTDSTASGDGEMQKAFDSILVPEGIDEVRALSSEEQFSKGVSSNLKASSFGKRIVWHALSSKEISKNALFTELKVPFCMLVSGHGNENHVLRSENSSKYASFIGLETSSIAQETRTMNGDDATPKATELMVSQNESGDSAPSSKTTDGETSSLKVSATVQRPASISVEGLKRNHSAMVKTEVGDQNADTQTQIASAPTRRRLPRANASPIRFQWADNIFSKSESNMRIVRSIMISLGHNAACFAKNFRVVENCKAIRKSIVNLEARAYPDPVKCISQPQGFTFNIKAHDCPCGAKTHKWEFGLEKLVVLIRANDFSRLDKVRLENWALKSVHYSRLCGNKSCCRPSHIIGESIGEKKARDDCHEAARMAMVLGEAPIKCDPSSHKPKCLRGNTLAKGLDKPGDQDLKLTGPDGTLHIAHISSLETGPPEQIIVRLPEKAS